MSEGHNFVDTFVKGVLKKSVKKTRCIQESKKLKTLKSKVKDIESFVKDCEKDEYDIITKYFYPGHSTNYNLLEALKKFYCSEKSKNSNFKLSMKQFIEMFPRDVSLRDQNFKRQHVFEQICRILLFFNCDNEYYGKKKEFYKKLETFGVNKDVVTKKELMEEKINEGSKAGSVDIFFKILEPQKTKDQTKKSNDNLFPCEVKEQENDNKKDTYILVQNKYYSKESSDISKYDATKIFTRASKILDKVSNFKVVLMVNSKLVLENKLKSYDKEGLDILGIDEIEPWFQTLLKILCKEDLKTLTSQKITERYIEPRFHQNLFINSTLRHLNEKKLKKFIWGAVPRSGKSFIIGGLISRRYNEFKNKKEKPNDVILILGAKAETEQQFIDIFNNFSDFKDKFGVSTQDNIKEDYSKPNIYIMSQEFLKYSQGGKKVNLDKTFEQLSKFKRIGSNKGKIDIYFDEIHKGGSTDRSQDVMNTFLSMKLQIDLFVMVTATFAKPNIAYEGFLEKQMPVVLQWGYEEQQLMKNVDTNELNLQQIKSYRNNDIDKEVIDSLLIEYEEKYGTDYLKILAGEYKNHPELVLISPATLGNSRNFFKEKDITDNFFKLKCSAIDYKSKKQLISAENIFENNDSIVELLKKISSAKPSDNSLFHYLRHEIDDKMSLDLFNGRNTQLWFLPTTNLYNNECSNVSTVPHDSDESDMEEQAKKTKKDPRPHIEPVTRGLALSIIDNNILGEKYNVLVVHNDKELFDKYFEKELNGTKYKDRIFCSSSASNSTLKKLKLVERIKFYEKKSYDSGRGLIILTGTKLRLGVSLPCADIALNFDNVRSVDSNYQTMFRVLTERNTIHNPKKYGYYIDFNLERTTEFVYEMSTIYTNSVKTSEGFDEVREKISNIYQLFNFNGISFSKTKNFKEVIKMYIDLSKKLKLDDENFKRLYLNNYQRTFGKIMLKYDLTELRELCDKKKGFGILFSGSDSITIENKGADKKGAEKHVKILPGEEPHETEPEEPAEEDPEEQDDNKLIKNLQILIPTIVVLLSLFSSDNAENDDFDCKNLEDCLNVAIEKIDNPKFIKICDCSQLANHPIGCYLKKFRKSLDETSFKKKLKNTLSIIRDKLFSSENPSKFQEIRNHLLFLYDNIKKDFKMTGGNLKKRTLKNNHYGGSRQAIKSKKLIHNMNSQDISTKIEQYLPIRSSMKDKYGEVFTPKSLIDEMMNKLKEIDPSVFKNPNLKWLDPANGTGNFPMVVFEMLKEGLKDYNKDGLDLRDETKRATYIIKNMLYMVELQPDNVMVSRKIFGKDSNIFCGSFLTPDNKAINPEISKKFGVQKFDIIMGNPPFQTPKKEEVGTTSGKGQLWPIFTKESLKILKNENSFLCFIHPPLWRKPEHELWGIIKSIQLKYLHIFGENDGKKYFNAGTRFDLYILKNKDNQEKTTIIDELSKKYLINIKNLPFLPNYEYKNIQKILTTKEYGIDIIYNTFYHSSKKMNKTKKVKGGTYIHPVVHSINKDGITPLIWTNNDKNGHFKIPKVLLNSNRHQYSHSIQNDFEGNYGMSELTFGIPISSKKEGDLILKAINTPAFKEIIKATKWGAFQTDYKMFYYFKKDFWKEFVNEDGNQLNKPEDSLEKPSEPIYMIKCPEKILNDPTIETHQKRMELCRRHYEDTKSKPPKPHPTQYCPKIKTKKNCEAMKKCKFKDGKCKSRIKKIIRKKKPETDK